MAEAAPNPSPPDAPRRRPIVRGAPLVLFAALQVGLVAASFSDAVTASGEPDPVDVRPTLTWVAVGSAAYLFVIWPLFLFASRRASDRPTWQTAAEGVCLLALAIPALIVAKPFSNAPTHRVGWVGVHLATLILLMLGLARLARRLPAAGRWILTAVEVLGMGLPLLLYFLADFSQGAGAWACLSPPLTAADLAGGSLAATSPAGLLALFGYPLVGGFAAGAAQFLPAGSPSGPPKP